jgi:DNA-directed RNA polymerase II subunit RPB3
VAHFFDPSFSFLKAMLTDVDDQGNRCGFTLQGVDLSIANGLRRSCHADVPTLAMEELEIETNTSVHPDEVLAHRLGLMTLKGSGDNTECSLDITCTAEIHMVTLRDFQWPENVQPVHSETPLVQLERGQSIQLKATIVWGTGQAHAKWDPCSRVSLKHLPNSSYRLEIDSKGQHPAMAVAIMGMEHMMDTLTKVAEQDYK